MADGGARSWLRYGCLGCLGLVALLFLVSVGFVAVAWMRAESAETVDDVREQVLPSAPIPEPVGPGRGVPTDALRRAGRVELDLSGAEFRLKPGPPGSALRLEGRFAENEARVVEEFEERAEEGWVYRARFEKTESSIVSALKRLFGAEAPRLTVYLPPDVPIELDLHVSRGGIDADLGGLDLRTFDLQVHQGGAAIDVSSPTKQPLDRMTVKAGMGGLALDQLGNASPRVLEIEFTMGGAGIDLEGAWRTDAEITLRNGGMGGGGVQLPSSGVRFEGLAGVAGADWNLGQPDAEEIPLPVLRFTDRTTWDDLDVSR